MSRLDSGAPQLDVQLRSTIGPGDSLSSVLLSIPKDPKTSPGLLPVETSSMNDP